MKGTSKTRTQRRMEKRQAVILLVLVLVVSLASFTLGVIVGRRGAERDLAQKIQQAERVLVTPSSRSAVAPLPMSAAENVVEMKPVEPVTKETKLSFYDDLAKETVPLGSGINVAPVEDKKVVEPVQPPIDLPDQPIVKKEAAVAAVVPGEKVQNTTAPVVSKKTGTGMPKAVSGGSHAVQIGSFGAAGDAITLKKKMLAKGYPAFVVEADLGKKGLWYRVRIGPYVDSAAAKLAQKTLEKREKIKGFIS
ncbi:MAG: SPOR domain-containing protein, partial [Sulfurovaceae bacterium]|nr:SPOR domain-containing protein [Sulfurovaceae bacterium]